MSFSSFHLRLLTYTLYSVYVTFPFLETPIYMLCLLYFCAVFVLLVYFWIKYCLIFKPTVTLTDWDKCLLFFVFYISLSQFVALIKATYARLEPLQPRWVPGSVSRKYVIYFVYVCKVQCVNSLLQATKTLIMKWYYFRF